MPEGTVNAIGLVVNYLLDNDLCNDAERAYLEAVKKLHDSTAGVGLGIDCADGPFGPLTIIGGKMSMDKKVTPEMLALAEENGIAVMQCKQSMFKVCGELYKAGLEPVF